MSDNRGRRPKPITIKEAFTRNSRKNSGYRCCDCRFYSAGWCSVKASSCLPVNFACKYGAQMIRSDKNKTNQERK